MRKTTVIVLSLMLLVSLMLPASAAAAGAFLLKEYDVTTESIYCYGKQVPAGGTLTVSVGPQVVENAVFSTLEKENIPVTVYCLVDTATSQASSIRQQQEDMLLTFSSLMSGQDNMVLGLVDSTLIEGKPMRDKTARDTAISTIEGQSWYTNLYDGMYQAMESLHTNTTYNTNRCLVILSEGHDDGKSTTTADKILKQIQDSGIPVYSVLLSTAGMTKQELSYHEQFAEESLGGFLCNPNKAGVSASVAAQQIWESIKGASAVCIDIEELQNSESDQQLLIRYDAGDTRYEDTVLIRAVDLAAVADQTETEGTKPPEHREKDEGQLFIAGGIVVLLVAGMVAFILLRKKNTHEEAPILQDIMPVEEKTDANFCLGTEGVQPIEISEWEQSDSVKYGCHVFATAIMHPEIATDFHLMSNVETTFGRSKADIILCEKDKKLSGIHGCFYWDGKMLLVRDMKSMNGTAVNGETCYENVWLRLEEGAILRAGNYEYRINIQVADESPK